MPEAVLTLRGHCAAVEILSVYGTVLRVRLLTPHPNHAQGDIICCYRSQLFLPKRQPAPYPHLTRQSNMVG